MIKYINKSGREIEINEAPANIAAAEKLGWTKAEAKKVKKSKKVVDNGDS